MEKHSLKKIVLFLFTGEMFQGKMIEENEYCRYNRGT